MRDLFETLRMDDVPFMARPNFAAELRHITLWGMFANLIDGSFSSIVVAKTFHSPLLVPVVWATPLLAHLLSFVWGVIVRDRPKVRTFMLLAFCAVASAGSIALTPSDREWGGWVFALQIALARIFMSGLVTIRTSIWNANYPTSHRARIAGRIQTISALLMVAMGGGVSLLFDQHAEYYRLVYPVIALLGLASLIPLRKVHVRGETRHLRRFNHRAAAAGSWPRLRDGLAEALAILRTDKPFAKYCSAQYLLGSANLMTDPILTVFLTQTARLGYFGSYLLMEQLPTLTALLTIGPWARLFDRVGVLRFRVVNSVYWLASLAFAAVALFVGTRTGGGWIGPALLILAAGRLLTGAGRGGGSIAWNLGHLQFAREHNAELYMGIHVALTGLRGLIMPFVGAFVYNAVGAGVMGIALVLGTAALVSFRQLARNAAEPTAVR